MAKETIEGRSIATLDAQQSRTRESAASFHVWHSRPHRTRGRKLVGSTTPGRAIKDALKQETRLSLDSPKKLSKDGSYYTHWSDNIAAIEVFEAEGDPSSAKKRYLTPAQREMLSVVSILSNPNPDGRVYSDNEIAQRLQIKASRVQDLRIKAESMWRKYSKTFLGTIYQHSLTKEHMTKNEQVTDNSGTEGPTSRGTLLRSGAKAFCIVHRAIRLVTDAFQLPNGLTLQLECGCRRPLKTEAL